MQSASAAPDPEALATQGHAGDSIQALGAVRIQAPVEETMTGGTGPTLIGSDQRSEISDCTQSAKPSEEASALIRTTAGNS